MAGETEVVVEKETVIPVAEEPKVDEGITTQH